MQTRYIDPNEVWAWGWENRVRQRVREQGYDSLAEYLSAKPGVPYRYLARELGSDVAPAQVILLQVSGARAGDREHSILDSIARDLREALHKGWGVGKYWDSSVDGILAIWVVAWDESTEAIALENALRALPPPLGWIPKDGNDPVLLEAARRAWGKEPD